MSLFDTLLKDTFDTPHDFSLIFHKHFLCIFPFSRGSELFIENRKFFYLACIWCSVGVTPFEVHQDLCRQNTKVSGLLCMRCGLRDDTFNGFARTPDL